MLYMLYKILISYLLAPASVKKPYATASIEIILETIQITDMQTDCCCFQKFNTRTNAYKQVMVMDNNFIPTEACQLVGSRCHTNRHLGNSTRKEPSCSSCGVQQCLGFFLICLHRGCTALHNE